VAIVGPTNSFWVSMYLQWQPSRLQARVSTATLMSFTAQPAADLRLVRPEHGGPGNNERPVSVLNKQRDSFSSPFQKSNRICMIRRNGPRQSGESRCSICSILAKWLRHWLKSRSIGVVSERWTWVRFIQGLNWIELTVGLNFWQLSLVGFSDTVMGWVQRWGLLARLYVYISKLVIYWLSWKE